MTEKPKLNCVHYWVCDPPFGRTSIGICKHCGEIREFYNSWNYQFQGDLVPVAVGAGVYDGTKKQKGRKWRKPRNGY